MPFLHSDCHEILSAACDSNVVGVMPRSLSGQFKDFLKTTSMACGITHAIDVVFRKSLNCPLNDRVPSTSCPQKTVFGRSITHSQIILVVQWARKLRCRWCGRCSKLQRWKSYFSVGNTRPLFRIRRVALSRWLLCTLQLWCVVLSHDHPRGAWWVSRMQSWPPITGQWYITFTISSVSKDNINYLEWILLLQIVV